MKASIKEIKELINAEIKKVLLKKEDTDRLRRAADKYGETEFEEDVDRVRRHKDGYGDDLEETVEEAEECEVTESSDSTAVKAAVTSESVKLPSIKSYFIKK